MSIDKIIKLLKQQCITSFHKYLLVSSNFNANASNMG